MYYNLEYQWTLCPATLDGEANFLLWRVLAFGRVIWFNSRLMEELASSPETSSKAVESSWDINLPNSKNTGLLIKNRKLTCTDARTKKWPSKLTISLEGKSYITSISIIKQKISWKNGMGSGFGHKIGRDDGIEKKKRRESEIWEPLLWTLEKVLMWVKNITDFGRFCYLNIPCLRMNITFVFMSFSSEEFTNK